MKEKVLFCILAAMLLLFMGACGSSESVSSQETASHELTLKVAMTSNAATSSLSSTMPQQTPEFTESPSSASLKFYNIYLSKNPDCSNPINIFQNTEGKLLDIVTNPVISVVNAPEGVYPCVMLEMSDQLTFTAPSTQGSCVANTQYQIDVCHTGEQTRNATTGALSDCEDNQEDIVTIYVSTNSVQTGGANDIIWFPFLPPQNPNDSEKGVMLNNNINLNQNIIGTFLIDFTNKVDGNADTCDLKPPAFGFVVQ